MFCQWIFGLVFGYEDFNDFNCFCYDLFYVLFVECLDFLGMDWLWEEDEGKVFVGYVMFN